VTTVATRGRRRRRRRRVGIAVQLTLSCLAVFVVLHPRRVPTPPAPIDVPTEQRPDATSSRDSAITENRSSAPLALKSANASRGRLFRSIEERARAGERVAVSITAYCLQGRTRLGTPVREGIIAVDRALFPLGSNVELVVGRKSLGAKRAEDTGGAIRGARIDLWVADCGTAKRFGRRRGYAQLLRPTR
jgi:3D (Asp-Asp-Asp) domain-containing protein